LSTPQNKESRVQRTSNMLGHETPSTHIHGNPCCRLVLSPFTSYAVLKVSETLALLISR
jgi:hypothetical protein